MSRSEAESQQKSVTDSPNESQETRRFASDQIRAALPRPGLILRDRYRLDSEIGRGAMGIVFRATDLELLRTVAVKVLAERLGGRNAHRRAVATRYRERLGTKVRTPPERDWAEAVYHMFVIRTARRDELIKFLAGAGVGTGMHYPVPNHRQPAITGRFASLPSLPRTEALVDEIVSLPVYGELPLADVDYVCDRIAKFTGNE